jgi:enolase
MSEQARPCGTAIRRILAREVLDSRGLPTVEVEVHCAEGSWGRALVPSGASTGKAEAHELRDGDADRYDGQGVRRAVANVQAVIGPALLDVDAADQAALDARLLELDPSPRKSQLGANALLGVSLAAAHAASAVCGLPLYEHLAALYATAAPSGDSVVASAELKTVPSGDSAIASLGDTAIAGPRMPLPMINMISGGLHAGGNLDFQDFLIMPRGADHYTQGLEWTVRVYRRLGSLLKAAGYESHLVGDEGGFGPRLPDHDAALTFLVRAIEAARLRPGVDVTIALDVAASHFFDGQSYCLKAEGDRKLSSDEMIDLLAAMVDRFPITSIEDALAEDDWDAWQRLTLRLGSRVQLVGDDLFTTNLARLRRGIQQGAANSLLVKVNQIGTLSEALATMHAAQKAGFSRVVSARSGETEDTTLADLAVGTAAQQIKIGSITRSERLAKYNQLLRIEERLMR